ncbi:MAG: GNAT family N-acetyltransferase [Actinomycetota bacterium]|nr:GNAT family N-acetyltransferase [Actinomycetota bacterium]
MSGPDQIERPTLGTTRLMLRPLAGADAPAVRAATLDADLLRWFPAWAGSTEREITAHVQAGDREDAVTLAVTAGGDFAGECWLSRVDPLHGCAEAGYWLAPGARGFGYGAEALAALAGWAFAELGLERIEVLAATANVVSQRVALRAGFRHEGVRRRAARSGTDHVDLQSFARCRDDPDGPAPRALPDLTELSDGVVSVRPLVGADAADWYAEVSDRDVQRWSGRLDPPGRAEIGRRAAAAPAAWLAGTEARLVVVAGGSYAGHISLRMTLPQLGTAEVGYALLGAHRGRGLMRRSLRLVGHWAFDQVGLARLEAGVGVDNAASQRTAEGAGFRREGVQRKALPGATGRYDIVAFSLLPEDLSP